MPTYSFTAPNGEKFDVNAPNGTTEEQARTVFNQQYNTGALTQLGIGQTLNGLSKTASQTLAQVAKLSTVSLTDPVRAAQVLKQLPATVSVGSLNTQQVTGLLSQAAKVVNQPFDVASVTKGIGCFGLTPSNLEQQGYLKPGTVSQFLGNNASADFTKILQSPAVWTGKSGIASLDSFLGNQNIQTITQQNIMNVGLSGMKSLGMVTGNETAQQLSGLVQGAAKFGPATMAEWAKGLASPSIVGSIANLAKGAQFAVGLVSKLFGGGGARSITPAAGTANRSAIDNAIVTFLGNSKIPPPRYGPIKRDSQ
jgi:hypothetical protein